MKTYYVTCRVECDRDFPPAFIRRILTDQAFFRVEDLRVSETPPQEGLRSSMAAVHAGYLRAKERHDTVAAEQLRTELDRLALRAKREYGWTEKDINDSLQKKDAP